MKRALLSVPTPLPVTAPLALSYFLTRPQLLTRLVPLPMRRDISPGHSL
jgi:hypothetical protein